MRKHSVRRDDDDDNNSNSDNGSASINPTIRFFTVSAVMEMETGNGQEEEKQNANYLKSNTVWRAHIIIIPSEEGRQPHNQRDHQCLLFTYTRRRRWKRCENHGKRYDRINQKETMIFRTTLCRIRWLSWRGHRNASGEWTATALTDLPMVRMHYVANLWAYAFHFGINKFTRVSPPLYFDSIKSQVFRCSVIMWIAQSWGMSHTNLRRLPNRDQWSNARDGPMNSNRFNCFFSPNLDSLVANYRFTKMSKRSKPIRIRFFSDFIVRSKCSS